MIAWLLLQGAPGGATDLGGKDVRAEFERYAVEIFAGDNPFLGARPRQDLEKALADPALPAEKRVEIEEQLAKEWVQAGEAERAIAALKACVERCRELGLDPTRAQRLLAMAYLRDAETRNCVERHNSECCIFPLKGGALHTDRGPAEAAADIYLEMLERNPADLESRWLLNVLSMALGRYPDDVPERWRLPPKAVQSEQAFPAWRDIASELGVDRLNLAGGVAVDDYDGDGWLDILLSSSDPRTPLQFLHNGGDGTFEDRSEAAGVTSQLGGLNLISGDYDNDGDQDALVLRGGWQGTDGLVRRSLIQNDGKAHFRDVTHAAGLAVPVYPSQAALWADLDGDGWLDLYAGNESRPDQGADFPSQLFRGRGDGSFVECAAEAGVENDRFAKGVAAGDYDNDGDLDLFVSNIGPKRMYENDGRARFTDVAPQKGMTGPPGRSFACWFFDQDNDGWLDLVVWGYDTDLADLCADSLGLPHDAVLPCLYRNRGNGSFRNVAKRLGLERPFEPMGANFGDVDNDGWLDVYLGTGRPELQALLPNVLLRNDRGQRFLDVTSASGTGHLQKGHGVAFADFDHDGDQDIFHQLGGFFPVDRFRNALFENPGAAGHWLTLELVGTRSNRDATGARVKLVLATPAGPREIHRAVGSVSSFGGSPHRQEIGLGDATRVLRLEVRWPRTAEPAVFEDVPLDAWLRIVEGAPTWERLERKGVRF